MKRLTLSLGLLACATAVSAQEKFPFIHSTDSIIKGVDLYDEGEYEKALPLFSQVPEGDTNYTLAIYEKALTLIELERYEEALHPLQKGITLNDSVDEDYFNLLGTAYDHLDRKEKSLEIYNLALDRFPMSYKMYFNRAVVYGGMGEHEKQLADLKTAIEIHPFHASSHLALANFALAEEQYAQALLSLGYFLMLEPKSQRANDAIVFFDKAVSDNTDLEKAGVELSEKDDFEKINLLVKNYVALRDDYEIDSDIDLPLIRQMDLVVKQAIKKKKLNGFWENYYLPFYKKMYEEDYFEPMIYLSLITSGNSYHQKVIGKNVNDIKEFIQFAKTNLRELHGHHYLAYSPSNEKVMYHFSDDNWLNGIGAVDKEMNPVGAYTLYYSTGALLGVGDFDDQGRKTGTWKYYHPSGRFKGTTNYKEGEKDGPVLEYHDNGNKYFDATYKMGHLHGITKVYAEEGYLDRQMHHVDGTIEDSLVYYFPHGTRRTYLPMKEGKVHGTARYFSSDGSLDSEFEYVDDQRQGPFVEYFFNKQVSRKGSFEENYYHGPYESYYPNGNLEAKGEYIEGSKAGVWESYYYSGKTSKHEEFDDKGKVSGLQQEFNRCGILTDKFVFSKGEIKEYASYAPDGSVIHEDKRKWGKFWYEGYSPEGILRTEGNYVGDHKEGVWKYYNSNGELTGIDNYNDDGDLHGNYERFYGNSTPERTAYFEHDTLKGYDVRYFSNGQMKEQGYNSAGKANGRWEIYFKDGSISIRNFYVNGSLNGPQYYFDPEGQLYAIKYYDEGVMQKIVGVDADTNELFVHEVNPLKGAQVYYYPNGMEMYHLDVQGDLLNGKALWKYGTGQKETEGQFLNDQRHGKWKWYYHNGQVQTEGQYVLGTRLGDWKSYYEDGTLKSETHYENGSAEGEYVSYHFNGKPDTRYTYDQGSIHGKRYFYDLEGKVDHIRFYDHGRIIGYSYLDKDGKEKPMVPLKMESGEVKSQFPNGKPSRQYVLKNGRFEGPYKEYSSNGKLRYESNYVNDELEGLVKHYYLDGKLREEINYLSGDRHGETKEYFKNGKLKRVAMYKNDKLHGEVKEYNEDGSLKTTYQYQNGSLYKKI